MANHLLDRVFSSGEERAPALIAADGTTRSYGDLRREVACAAAALAALGVRPGDRVAAQIEKSAAGFALYLGAVMAGAVFLPLNIAYTVKELAYFLGDAEPTVVVCDPTRADAIAAITSAKVETLDGMGRGTLRDRMGARRARLRRGRTRARRSRRDPLHVGHDRALEGCDADPRQPALERRNAGRLVAHHGRGPAAACAPDLPHAWLVHRGDDGARCGRRHDLPAEVRCGRTGAADAGGDRS